jgi:hypothetical protein
MARCATCQAEIPFRVALKKLLTGRRGPDRFSYACSVCNKISVVSFGVWMIGVLFITIPGAATAVLIFKSSWFRPYVRYGEFVGGLVMISCFWLWYFIWWKFVARLKASDLQ